MRSVFLLRHRPAQDGHRTTIRLEDIEHHPNGRSVARTVATEQAKDLAAFDGE